MKALFDSQQLPSPLTDHLEEWRHSSCPLESNKRYAKFLFTIYDLGFIKGYDNSFLYVGDKLLVQLSESSGRFQVRSRFLPTGTWKTLCITIQPDFSGWTTAYMDEKMLPLLAKAYLTKILDTNPNSVPQSIRRQIRFPF